MAPRSVLLSHQWRQGKLCNNSTEDYSLLESNYVIWWVCSSVPEEYTASIFTYLHMYVPHSPTERVRRAVIL
jgi:hypothetical protein